MPQANRILLIDDGELSNVARILEALGLDHTRVRGQRILGKLAPPSELLITTPCCAQLVRRGSPPDAPSGRPVRIIGASEDSSSMRRRLRRMGYHLLVGLPGSDDVWRPLIHRATYRGEERRQEARVIVGSEIGAHAATDSGESLAATLMNLSFRGCQLLVPRKLDLDSELSLTLSETTTTGRPLTLKGRVTRISEDLGDAVHETTVALDEDSAALTQAELAGVVNLWSFGPPSHPGQSQRLESAGEGGMGCAASDSLRIAVDAIAAASQPIVVDIDKTPRTK